MNQYSAIKEFFDLSLPEITHEQEIQFAISIQKNFVPFKNRQDLSVEEKARFRKGSADRERLIRSNVKLIKSIARRFEPSGIETRILLDFGMIGLITATESYDPYKINPKSNKPFKFSTHATWQILKETSIGVDKYRCIRIPGWVRTTLATLKAVKAELKQVLGRNATDSEIIERMPPTGKFNKPFTQERLDFLRRSQNINRIRSIDAMTFENDDGSVAQFDIKDSFDAWSEIELREELELIESIKPKKSKRKKRKKSKSHILRVKDFSKKLRSGHQLGLKISIKIDKRKNAKRRKVTAQSRPIEISSKHTQQLTLDLEADTIFNFSQFDRNVRRYA